MSNIVWTLFFLAVAGAALFFFYRDLTATLTRLNEKPIATVILRDRVVQRHFSDRLVWDMLRNGSPVYAGDTIRTADLSGVEIVFTNKDSVELGENSMAQLFFGKEGATVDISDGSISAKSGGGGKALTLVSGGKQIKVHKGGQVKAKVAPEGTSPEKTAASKEVTLVVQVVQGSAQIESGGKTQDITKGDEIVA
jgi:hypothetical protein